MAASDRRRLAICDRGRFRLPQLTAPIFTCGCEPPLFRRDSQRLGRGGRAFRRLSARPARQRIYREQLHPNPFWEMRDHSMAGFNEYLPGRIRALIRGLCVAPAPGRMQRHGSHSDRLLIDRYSFWPPCVATAEQIVSERSPGMSHQARATDEVVSWKMRYRKSRKIGLSMRAMGLVSHPSVP